MIDEVGDDPRGLLSDGIFGVADAVDDEWHQLAVEDGFHLRRSSADAIRQQPQGFLAESERSGDVEEVTETWDDIPFKKEVRRVVGRGVVAEGAEAWKHRGDVASFEEVEEVRDDTGIEERTKASRTALRKEGRRPGNVEENLAVAESAQIFQVGKADCLEMFFYLNYKED